jgi:hypothetical protein
VLPGTIYNTPIFQMSGTIIRGDGQTPLSHPRVAVLWVLDAVPGSPGNIPSSPSTVGTDLDETGSFTLSFYAPPPVESLFELMAPPGETAPRLSFGEIVLYDDGGEPPDGTFHVTDRTGGSTIEPPDVYRGGGLEDFVAYVWQRSDSQTLVRNAGSIVSADVGYHQGRIDCMEVADSSNLRMLGDPVPMLIHVTGASAPLPYERTCLQ